MGLSIGTLFPLRLRLWLGRLLFRHDARDRAVRVSWHRLIKGPCDPPEVEAMRYVAAHTRIPIPALYKIHTAERDGIYLEMEYVQGVTLAYALPTLSAEDKASLSTQLRRYLATLRALRPPAPGVVSSAYGNPAYDGRIGSRFFGPMSVDAFQAQARGFLVMDDVPLLGDAVQQVHTTRYETVFTHADLATRNIIVRGGEIAAIIDWAYAGWYPAYWEFTKAHYVLPEPDWVACVRGALPRYDTELAAEQILWERLPEPGTTMRSYRDGVVTEHPGSSPSATWLEARLRTDPNDLWSFAIKIHPIMFCVVGRVSLAC